MTKYYYLVEHDDWDEPRKIYFGPNSNIEGLGPDPVHTIGSSPQCKWTLPDSSLPDIVAIMVNFRSKRNYLYELNPEDYGSTNREDFLKRKPALQKGASRFEVAGYRFLSRHSDPIPQDSRFDSLRAAYLQTWDGHISPGDFEGYERDLAAYTAWKNGEDIHDVVRKEREAWTRAIAEHMTMKSKPPYV